MEPNEHRRIQAEKVRRAEDPATIKREFFDTDGNKISRKLSKKLKRINRRPNRSWTTKNERNLELCSIDLVNPVVNSDFKSIDCFGKLIFHFISGSEMRF